MIIAVLKETADYERRVALTPPAAQKLTADGTKIKMEKGAGKAAGFADKEYENAGVEIALPQPDADYTDEQEETEDEA